MKPEQRQRIIEILKSGEDISREWARILFPPEKREYELVYDGKDREEDIFAETMAIPLQPVRSFGKNANGWHNRLIFGDNLQAIKTLLNMKERGEIVNADGTPGVRLIYIDPPFATKRDFHGSKDQRAYQDKIAGAEFLEFLRKRLVLLGKLLSADGSIYVHLDPKKGHYVKLLMDEIFGESCFRNEIIWFYPRGGDADKQFNRKHDSIYWYSRNSEKWTFNWEDTLIPYTKEQLARFKEKDKNGKFYWNVNPRGETVKTYLRKPGIGEYDVWNIGINATEIKDIGYPTAKPPKLIERIVRASSNKGDIVLDAFAGSGTTLAVAEKLARRWIGIDCGKLAIYTIQKRLLNLCNDIREKEPKFELKPFTLYNAGLYDFSSLRQLPWESWRFFALQLFQCREEQHTIGGVKLDGYLKGASVLVFNHLSKKDVRIDEETIKSLHEALGNRIGSKLFIIAPALTFDFQQDYILIDSVRYYALRIPYSIINELHRREFTALKQPSDEMAVNDTVEAVGFDFIRTPDLKFECGSIKDKAGKLGYIKIITFKSDAVVREPMRKKDNLETLSMVMLDYNFNEKTQIFDLDAVFYADSLQKENWELRFPTKFLGKKLMAVFIDIYGNEARVSIDTKQFAGRSKNKAVIKSSAKTNIKR